MTAAMAADTGHSLPEEAVREKVETLLEQGYPLSQEQSLAIRHATIMGGRVAVIEGAAGSGKTTTLRPITDLHREHGYEIVPTAVAWRTAVALGDDCAARAYCVDKLLKLVAKEQVEIGRNTPDRGGRGGDAVDPPGPSHPPALRATRREGGVRRRHAPAAAGGGGARVAAESGTWREASASTASGVRRRTSRTCWSTSTRRRRSRRASGPGSRRRGSAMPSSPGTRRWRGSRCLRRGRWRCRKRSGTARRRRPSRPGISATGFISATTRRRP